MVPVNVSFIILLLIILIFMIIYRTSDINPAKIEWCVDLDEPELEAQPPGKSQRYGLRYKQHVSTSAKKIELFASHE